MHTDIHLNFQYFASNVKTCKLEINECNEKDA